ncbi:phosphatidylglycerophosphatase A family protein [Alteromonas sp. CYL-A6]|uniref:phosphatidylglycerophosphatase A family protein n=1 Tax=Alteromonas nitratireducens TaxID=3390813 RepID=UPI0034BD5B44
MAEDPRQRLTMTNPVHLLAVGFGSGLIRFMPGTWGSLAAVPLLLLMAGMSDVWYVAITLVSCVAGVAICGRAAEAMKVHDHGAIVWDEIAGMMLTFLFIPVHPSSLVAGFILFRFFDIVKPWPIGVIDKHVHGGAGIMLDDIVAGLMACGSLHLIAQFLV